MNFVEDVTINPADLTNELIKQAGIFAYYAQALSDADYELNRSKIALTAIESKLYLHYKATLEGKPTEATIKANITQDKQHKEAENEVMKKQKARADAKVKVDALIQKKDMLIQLCSLQRSEMHSGVNIS